MAKKAGSRNKAARRGKKKKSTGKPPGWVIAKRARWALAELKKRHIPLDTRKS